MHVAAILLPVFVQVALTFGLLMLMAAARGRDLASGNLRLTETATDGKAWGPKARLISNCYDNQFATPMLFYVLVALALITRKADYLFIVMEWVFVLARLGHAFIHTGSNIVAVRGRVFLVSTVVLIVMWVIFAIRILFAPALL